MRHTPVFSRIARYNRCSICKGSVNLRNITPIDSVHSNSTSNNEETLFRQIQMARSYGNKTDQTSVMTNTNGLLFDDAQEAFQSKSTWELARALLVFKLCTVRPLVVKAKSILSLSEKVFGRSLTYLPIRHTFFAHFCAGEDAKDIQPALARLRGLGVGGILDYAAEADVDSDQSRDLGVDPNKMPTRTYDYVGEAECDKNLEITLSSIQTAAVEKGFAAVKLTSLGQPELLRHVSQVLHENRRWFRKYASIPTTPALNEVADMLGLSTHDQRQLEHTDSPYNPYLHAVMDKEQFLRAMRESNLEVPEEEVVKIFERMDTDEDGRIDYSEWMDYLSAATLGRQEIQDPGEVLTPGSPVYTPLGALTKLNTEEQHRLYNMIVRSEKLAQAAAENGVSIMFDAEQTYLQPAIDHVVTRLQQQYNKERPVVFNTLQAYLTDCESRLKLSLTKARRQGYYFGAKLVRGAYMIQERRRATEYGYKDPIQPTLEDTHVCYNNCIRLIMDNSDIAEMMIASHNEDSIRLATQLMHERGISVSSDKICFGQLLGMCDHVSLTLGKHGYSVYKYVPYGPIHEVLPYLIRRAEENGDLLSNAIKERTMLWSELLRRLHIPSRQTVPMLSSSGSASLSASSITSSSSVFSSASSASSVTSSSSKTEQETHSTMAQVQHVQASKTLQTPDEIHLRDRLREKVEEDEYPRQVWTHSTISVQISPMETRSYN